MKTNLLETAASFCDREMRDNYLNVIYLEEHLSRIKVLLFISKLKRLNRKQIFTSKNWPVFFANLAMVAFGSPQPYRNRAKKILKESIKLKLI